VDALTWPYGVEMLMQVVGAYRDYRRTIKTGRTRRLTGVSAVTGEPYDVEVEVCKDEHLEIEELDRAVRYLITQLLERDSNWTLEQPAL
jgi:hypothetical protein